MSSIRMALEKFRQIYETPDSAVFTGLPVGTITVRPEQVDAMSWCRGESVRLEDEINYPNPILKIETARMVARNTAPSDRSVAIIKIHGQDETDSYKIYTLSHDVQGSYYKEESGIIYSDLHKMGSRLPKNAEIVEIYNSERTPFVLTDIDPTPPHRYPEVGEPVVCLNNGRNNLRVPVDLTHERIVGNRVFYAYHTLPASRIEADGKTPEAYGVIPEPAEMSEENLAGLAYFIEQADTAEKIMRLDLATLVAAGPSHRVKLIETVLRSDLRDNEKGALALILLKTIPSSIEGRDCKGETRQITSALIKDGLMNDIWDVCKGPLRDSMLRTLREKGAPDNIFSPENLPVEMSGSFVGGVLDSAASMIVGIKELASDPLGTVLPAAGTILQYGWDKSALYLLGDGDLTADSRMRSEQIETLVGTSIQAKKDSYDAAWRFGVGELYGMDIAGWASMELPLLLYPLGGVYKETALFAKSAEAAFIYENAGRAADLVKRWASVFGQVPVY